jgi:hypothetical protein
MDVQAISEIHICTCYPKRQILVSLLIIMGRHVHMIGCLVGAGHERESRRSLART